MTKLAKLFKNTDIKIAYKTNKNKLQNLNSSHNKDNSTTNGMYKIECQDCNKCYIGQTKIDFLVDLQITSALNPTTVFCTLHFLLLFI